MFMIHLRTKFHIHGSSFIAFKRRIEYTLRDMCHIASVTLEN